MNRYFFIITWIVFSFSVKGQNIEKEIIGIWNFETFNQDSGISYYVPAKKLKKKITGFRFEKDGIVIARIDGAGCSIIDEKGKSYSFLSNIKGNWKLTKDNSIQIKVETFMGLIIYKATVFERKLKITNRTFN